MTISYRDCMSTAMRSFPKGISREARGRLFCIEAKICSGKFTDRKAAEQNCIDNPPAPRERKARGSKRASLNCGQEMATLAGCAVQKLDLTQVGKATFVEDVALALAIALQECGCKSNA